MVDVEAGFKYPLRGDGSVKLHAIGGGVPVVLNVLTGFVVLAALIEQLMLLLLLPIAALQLFVGVLWTGYFLRVVRSTFDGGTEPPGFEDVGSLLHDGFWGGLVVVAYQVPGVVLMIGGYLLAFVFLYGARVGGDRAMIPGAATAGAVSILILVLLFLVWAVYSLGVLYLLPISLTAYAEERSLGTAFSLDTLLTVGRSSEYVKSWAASVGVFVLVYTLISFLTALFVGYLLLPFLPILYFYFGSAAFYMFGESYANATGIANPSSGGVEDAVGAESTGGIGTRQPEDV